MPPPALDIVFLPRNSGYLLFCLISLNILDRHANAVLPAWFRYAAAFWVSRYFETQTFNMNRSYFSE